MKKSKVRLIGFQSVIGCALVLLIVFAPALVVSDTITILRAPEVSKVVVVRDATVRDNLVLGEVRNLSLYRVRDVELLIRNIWHWHNDFRPGENSPGFGDYYTVSAEILPGATERFTYRMPSPLPARPDGYFETVVTVAGFTEIKEASQEEKNMNDWQPVS